MRPKPLFELAGKTIWIAGETGMVGRALQRRLESEPAQLVSAPHSILDLTRQDQTEQWIGDNRPDIIILAAGRVGGIGDNTAHPAEFIYENMVIAQNVIYSAYKAGVRKLIYLGSSCIYPKMAEQPIKEESLLSGALEPTNEFYAMAKIAGVKLCQAYRCQYGCDYIAVMPTNLYGPHDKFDAQNSHVIPAMMMKLHQAKIKGAESVELWGTGKPLREFMHVDDLADGLVYIAKNYSGEMPLNIGSGEEVSILELARMLKDIINYNGTVSFNTDYPDGTPRKKLDCSRLNQLGWQPSISLEGGLHQTYQWFCQQESTLYQAA